MGHIHLATLPSTKQWGEVARLLDDGADDVEVIRASAIAAEDALADAAQDPTLIAAVHLLAMVPQAARGGEGFAEKLHTLDVIVPQQPLLGDVAAGLSLALERVIARSRPRTDLGEIARRALLGTLTTAANDALPGLIEADADDVRAAIGGIGRPKTFSRAARAFFGRLAAETLGCWLDRTLSTRVGPDRRFGSLAGRDAFDRALDQYCVEATRIIREFAGDWYSLRLHVDGAITPQRAAAFTEVAFRKITEELRRKRGGDA